ncbi:MAG: hypothetical protein ABIZ49_12635 [Opitutaceae bacterium]
MTSSADDSAASTPAAFRPETQRGVPGFFHAGQDAAGFWWLIDPNGRPVWCKAVHEVRAAKSEADGSLAPDSAARLRAWGFDTVGVAGDGAGWDDGFAIMAAANFCEAGPLIVGPGLRLPDVFDPRWPQLAQERAVTMCTPLSDHRNMIGWVTDEAPLWAQPVANGQGWPSLLQLCLSLEPGFAAYHAAWEFALALHGGRLDALARAWEVTLANKEGVRELTRADTGLATRGYLRDEARWTREFARRYFSSTAAAIRAADPNHLALGCRFDGIVGAHVLAECVYPAVDVAMPDWRELPGLAEGNAKNPVFAGNVSWTEEEFWRSPASVSGGVQRLTSVERMLRRGRAGLERAARQPAVVGYVWRQWQDEPGEQPPFARGLVHVNGVEAREHTELLTGFNARAEAMRRASATRTESLKVVSPLSNPG